MKDVRPYDEAVQLLDKELVLDIKSPDQHNKQVDIFRIIFAILVLPLRRWRMDDALDKSFHNVKVNLLGKVLLISVKLSKGTGLAYFQTALVRQQDRKILIDSSLVLRALPNEPVDELETYLEDLLMLLTQLLLGYSQQIHILLQELENRTMHIQITHHQLSLYL